MPLINPGELKIATVECTLCNETITSPSDAERMAFSAAHVHGNATLQAWFEKRAAALQARESGE